MDRYTPPTLPQLPFEVAGEGVLVQLVSVATSPGFHNRYMLGEKDAERAGIVRAIDEDYWLTRGDISPRQRPDVGEVWALSGADIVKNGCVEVDGARFWWAIVRAPSLVAQFREPVVLREPDDMDFWPAPGSFLVPPDAAAARASEKGGAA